MSETVTDAKGRVITIRTLGVLDQVRMLRAIGPDQSRNEPYVNVVQAALMAGDIDGVPVIMPQNERQIDTVIGLLGSEGLAALTGYMVKQIKDIEAAAESAGVTPSAPLETPAS